MSDAYEFELNGQYVLYDHYAYYEDNVLHRLNGPAVVFFKETNKCPQWYYKGERVSCSSQEEFLRIIKLKVFL